MTLGKAKVEVGVQIVERWIVAALRHYHFYSVTEINEAIAELLERLNHRRFRKREGTRASLFAELDRPALQSLPVERYQLAEWKSVRANIDYHVEIDRHYYSVPYQLVGRALEARFTSPPRPSRSFITVCVWLLIRAAVPLTATPLIPNIARRATRRIWNGLLRA
jgi:transposase